MDRLQEAFTSDDCASGYDPMVGTGPYEFWYEYNAAGNLLEVLDTQAGTVLADYDYGDTGVNAGTNAAHNWDPNPGSAVAISYDRSGNMTSWGADVLEWDADNRLRFYDKATGDDTSMVYDADGNRVARITGTTVTTYIGDLYESDGTTTTAYYPFAGETVSYRQATASSDARYYLTADHLDSTTTVVESTDLSNPVDQYYYPYGQPRTTWTINTDRAYTGQTSDQDQTGLYDYNARYYHPTLHRFISADTIVPDPANPQAHNRYSYVANNPTTNTDPSGHFIERNMTYGGGGGAGDPDSSDGTLGGSGTSVGGGGGGEPLADLVIAAFRWAIFDPTPCTNGEVLSCTIELAALLPILGKLFKVFKHSDEVADIYKYGTSHIDEAGDLKELADMSGMLRAAARGKGNFGIGSAPKANADMLGQAWVGPNFTVARDGRTLISADGLRQFRPPSYKPQLGRFQANFEQRFQPFGPWQSNAHLDISDLAVNLAP